MSDEIDCETIDEAFEIIIQLKKQNAIYREALEYVVKMKGAACTDGGCTCIYDNSYKSLKEAGEV
jgi:hypothetical protein